jgi:cytochrome b6-f complex iron-sulfur subunit
MNHNKINENNSEENVPKICRRKFLNAMGNTATGIVVFGGLGVTLDFLKPNVILEIPKEFKVGPIDSIQPNSVIYEPEQKAFVVRDEQGSFYALSAVCTHLGCTTKWTASGVGGNPNAVIACPCHGSFFNKKGELLQGPAQRGLDKFRLRLEDNKLVVNTAEIVSEEEMILKI